MLRLGLQRGQTLRLRATTDSMRPTIVPGTRLLVRGEMPEVGDIAVARVGNNWVTHRVAAIDGDVYVLHGDTSGHNEVPAAQVVGRVIAVQRDLTSWTWWARRRLRGLRRKLLGRR